MPDFPADWLSRVADCLAAAEREQASSASPVVDHEIVTALAGGPEDLVVWLVCRNAAEQREFRDHEFGRFASGLRRRLLAAGLSEATVASLTLRVATRDDLRTGSAFLRR